MRGNKPDGQKAQGTDSPFPQLKLWLDKATEGRAPEVWFASSSCCHRLQRTVPYCKVPNSQGLVQQPSRAHGLMPGHISPMSCHPRGPRPPAYTGIAYWFNRIHAFLPQWPHVLSYKLPCHTSVEGRVDWECKPWAISFQETEHDSRIWGRVSKRPNTSLSCTDRDSEQVADATALPSVPMADIASQSQCSCSLSLVLVSDSRR